MFNVQLEMNVKLWWWSQITERHKVLLSRWTNPCPPSSWAKKKVLPGVPSVDCPKRNKPTKLEDHVSHQEGVLYKLIDAINRSGQVIYNQHSPSIWHLGQQPPPLFQFSPNFLHHPFPVLTFCSLISHVHTQILQPSPLPLQLTWK